MSLPSRSPVAFPMLSEPELLDALRCGELEAAREFIRRFQPSLDARARRFGLAPVARDELVLEVLHDVALSLVRRPRALRKPVLAYLTTALANRLRNARRDGALRVARERAAADALTITGAQGAHAVMYGALERERVVAGTLSQATVRESGGPEWEPPLLAPVVDRLAAALRSELTANEERLLVLVSEYVPLRDIARVLGVSRGAAKTRLFRLRQRLRERAIRFAATLDDSDRAELARFFRRTHTLTSAELARVESARSVEPSPEEIHHDAR